MATHHPPATHHTQQEPLESPTEISKYDGLLLVLKTWMKSSLVYTRTGRLTGKQIIDKFLMDFPNYFSLDQVCCCFGNIISSKAIHRQIWNETIQSHKCPRKKKFYELAFVEPIQEFLLDGQKATPLVEPIQEYLVDVGQKATPLVTPQRAGICHSNNRTLSHNSCKHT